MKESTSECRKDCDVYNDWCQLEADNVGLILDNAKLQADKLEVIEDYIKVNQAKMSQMAFCKKHNISYGKFSKIAYVIEAEIVTENLQLQAKLAEVEAENKKLKLDLIEFGRHGEGCRGQWGEQYRCKCGWLKTEKALKENER